MRRRGAALAWLATALVVAGCVTLTPAQEGAVAEVRAMADDTARIYGVSRISVLVGSNIEGVGGSYRRGLFTISTPMLRSRHRDSIVAHELAHYLLEHDRPLRGTLALDWQREQELRELAANAKAVEILVRVRALREEQALSLVYDHLLSFNRLVTEQRTVIPWGHRPPCDEIADLLGRFPAHRAWTDGLACGPAGARTAAAVERRWRRRLRMTRPEASSCTPTSRTGRRRPAQRCAWQTRRRCRARSAPSIAAVTRR